MTQEIINNLFIYFWLQFCSYLRNTTKLALEDALNMGNKPTWLTSSIWLLLIYVICRQEIEEFGISFSFPMKVAGGHGHERWQKFPASGP